MSVAGNSDSSESVLMIWTAPQCFLQNSSVLFQAASHGEVKHILTGSCGVCLHLKLLVVMCSMIFCSIFPSISWSARGCLFTVTMLAFWLISSNCLLYSFVSATSLLGFIQKDAHCLLARNSINRKNSSLDDMVSERVLIPVIIENSHWDRVMFCSSGRTGSFERSLSCWGIPVDVEKGLLLTWVLDSDFSGW